MLIKYERLNFIGFWIRNAECFYRYGFHPLILQGAVGVIGGRFGNFINIFHALNHLSEGCVRTVKVGSVFMHDKEL